MAKMQLLNQYTLMREDTGQFIREGDRIDSITYYDEELKTTVTEKNVEIIGIDDFGVEIKKDNGCYNYIDLESLEEFE